MNGIENGEAIDFLTALARSHTADKNINAWLTFLSVLTGLLTVKQSGLSSDTLANNFGVFSDKNTHDFG